jgi:general secretion pathway protein D
MRYPFVRFLVPCLLLAAAAGCSGYRNARQAEVATREGKWDEAVLQYIRALETDPDNIGYKAGLLRAKIKASQEHFEKGKQYQTAGVIERAMIEYEQAVQLDPTNQYAKAELDHARVAYEMAQKNQQPETIDEMKRKTRNARPQPPELNPRSNDPISLEFPQPVSIFDIYRALGKAYGINILFDPNLKDQEIAVDLKNVDAQAALEFLMRAAGHFYKVMDPQTIIIAADNPQNRRIYEDLVIQTFFLSNSEVKDMTTILRSLIDARKIATNEQLNAIILRDTADKVKVAQRIIETNDKSKAEVVVDVELLQINTGKMRDLGISLSNYQVQQSLDLGSTTSGTTTTAAPVHLSDLRFLNQSNWALTIPSFLYNFMKQSTEAQLLAKPQLRITEGEKANLVIGDRVPIPLTTFNTSNTIGGNIVPITSFQYQDVGIRIEMEPRVHHNQEVTIKLKVEVSQLNGAVSGSGGQSQPIIGTRTIDSTIRLKDGETNFLAGLIRSDSQSTDNGVPGVSEIPILGRLFSNKNTSHQRTDVILTITPHIIRQAEITEEDLLPIWAGTEANVTFRGGSPRVESDVEGPFEGNEGTPEQIQDAIRRRVQRLPRGLRPGEAGAAPNPPQQPPQQAPPGVDLAPARPPTDIFRPPAQPTPPTPPPPSNPEGGGEQGGQARLDGAAGAAAGDLQETAAVDASAAAPRAALAAASTAPAAVPALAAARSSVRGGGAAVQLWLAPQRLQVAPGDRFQVTLEASSAEPVSHLPLALAFDPKVLAVEKVEAGDFLGGTDVSQVLSDASRGGDLVIGASRLGKVPGVAGKGTLARITFRALAAGSSRLEFHDSGALDAGLRPLAAKMRPALVEVAVPAAPVTPGRPVPAVREGSGVSKGLR